MDPRLRARLTVIAAESAQEVREREARVESAASPAEPICRTNFAEVIARVQASNLPTATKRDLRSALTRVAKWIGEDPENIPADPAWLRQQMKDWTAARFGVADTTFSVVLSQLRRALRLTAPPNQPTSKRAPLTPEWLSLKDALARYWAIRRVTEGPPPGQNWLAIRLARFMRWCSVRGIAPESVAESHVVQFIDEITTADLRGNIDEKERGLRKAWNHAATHVRGWPKLRLATTRTPSRIPAASLSENRFPGSFLAELDRYHENCGFLYVPEPDDDHALTYLERVRRRRDRRSHRTSVNGGLGRRLGPLAPSSLYWHRRVLIMTASALVDRGVKSLEAIRSIADVACLDGCASLIDAYDSRHHAEAVASPYRGHLVATLLSIIARCGLRLPPDELMALDDLARDLGAEGGDNGLTVRNRKRLSQFDDPDNFALLISCSEHEMDRLEAERRRKGAVSVTMARRAEAAIGNLLLITLPVRRRALATLDWRRNFRAPSRRGGTATLVYHPDQSKTKRPQQVVLDAWKWRLLELYWRHYRDHLSGADRSTYLFPGSTPTGLKTFGKLAAAITQFVARRTGLQMNLHLYRHVMGAKLLEETKDMHLVEELLGHVPGSRATRRYAELKAKWAADALDRITDAQRPRGQHLHRRRERRFDRRRLSK